MLKQHGTLINFLERLCDNVVVVASFIFAFYLRDSILSLIEGIGLPLPEAASDVASIDSYYLVLLVGLLLYNVLLPLLGAYRSMRFRSYWQIFRTVCMASAVVFLAEGAILYLLKLDLSRSIVGFFCVISAVLLFFERTAALFLLRHYRRRGKNFRNLLIVGDSEQVVKIYDELEGQPDLGVKVVGLVLFDESNLSFLQEKQQLGSEKRLRILKPEQFEAALKRFAIDDVLFAESIRRIARVEHLMQIASEEGVGVSFALNILSLDLLKSDVSKLGEMNIVHYRTSPNDSFSLVAKRAIDIVVSGAILVLTSPLLLLVALLIKLETPGPVFFKQKRIGLNGRVFTLLKFRSMVKGAEGLLRGLKDKNEMSGPVFKIKEDPRITRLGKFLRRYSIDEMPQFINVLMGEMSIVGPRPPIPEEVKQYKRKQRRRLSMRPGITCTWQVSGRNKIPDFDSWAELDLEYIDNWSLANDLKLIAKTIPAVLTGTGS